MRFLSNFGCKIIFVCSNDFWHQQDSNSLFKGHWSRDLLVQVAYWLTQTGFFLDLEGTFCNQGNSYAFPPKIRLYTSCRFPFELR